MPAREILHRHKVEKLLVVDQDFKLKELITVKDIQKQIKYPNASKDSLGRLRVGAAVGIARDTPERAAALVSAHADVLDRRYRARTFAERPGYGRKARARAPRHRFDCGQCRHGRSDRGADRTQRRCGEGRDRCRIDLHHRVIAGIGVPMITAVMECARTAAARNIPVIADGGIRFSGDITKAIAVGASSVMIGNLFAVPDESPGELILYQGRSFKEYRGMGSIGAMRRGSRDRYFRMNSSSKVPRGPVRKACARRNRRTGRAQRQRRVDDSPARQRAVPRRDGLLRMRQYPTLQKGSAPHQDHGGRLPVRVTFTM